MKNNFIKHISIILIISIIPILIGFCFFQSTTSSSFGMKFAEAESINDDMNSLILCKEDQLAINNNTKFFSPLSDIFLAQNYIEILPVKIVVIYSPDIFYPDLDLINVTILRL